MRRKLVATRLPEPDTFPDEDDKTAVIEAEAPKTITYVAKHVKGGVIPFRDIGTVAIYFDVAEQTLINALAKGAYKLRGRMKQWTIEKIEK
ncbi:hypothetical protein NHG29_01720 [Aerococcaceae bacterium NML160702]|nr:hypothetical protein [Aerococcaceae bacterium NML160702]